MDESPLLLQREPPVATVVFNRPEARNALNEAMQRAMPPMLEQLRKDADIRVLILRGAGGRAFAAGDDISQFVAWGARKHWPITSIWKPSSRPSKPFPNRRLL